MSIILQFNEPGIGIQDRSALLWQGGDPATFTLQRGSRGTATLMLQLSNQTTYLPAVGWPCYINEVVGVTVTRVFAGTVDTVTLDWQGIDGYRIATITLVSLEQCFDTILVDPPVSLFGHTAGYIVNYLLTTYASGVPVSAGTIQAGITEPTEIYDHDRLSDIFSQLATDCGFIWYVDPATLQLNFCAETTTAAPFTLHSNQILWETLEWEQTRSDFRDRQTVRCSFSATNPRTERFANTTLPMTVNVSQPINSLIRVTMETGGAVATVDGTFSGQPAPGDTVTLDSVQPYTFVATLDNTQPSQVLIGATAAATAQNLIDAINVSPATKGVGYSLPTIWNGGFIAGPLSTLTFTVSFADSGTVGNGQASTTTSGNFSWSNTSLSGGVDATGSVELQPTQDVTFIFGDTEVDTVNGMAGDWLVIVYYPIGQDCVAVEDSALVAARAAIEHGTGKYQQLENDSNLTDIVSAYYRALGLLNAYKVIPVSIKFETDSPLLLPGQYLAISVVNPSGAGPLMNGNYVVQEVDADLIPGMANAPAGGHFRYTVTVINTPIIGNYIQFYENLANANATGTTNVSGGGGGAAGGGTGSLNQVTVSSTPYAVQPGDDVITFAAGSSVANLPQGSSLTRRSVLYLLNRSGGTITVNPHSGDTTFGLSSFTITDGADFQIIPNS